MDYKESPLYPHMSALADTYHENCASHFNGGQYLFMQRKPPIEFMRTLYSALGEANVMVSLNDFPSPFASKRNLPISLFERHYVCPTGTLDIALKQQAMLAAAWVRGTGRGRFQVEIRALQGDTVDTVMADYLHQLHQMIELDPSLWEGWKWLPQ
jgi:hypothetical protein